MARRSHPAPVVLVALGLLAACGGGGSVDSPPAPSVSSPATPALPTVGSIVTRVEVEGGADGLAYGARVDLAQ